MRKLVQLRPFALATAVAGLLAAVCALSGFEHLALALVGAGIALLSAVLLLVDRDSRDRALPRNRRRAKAPTQLDAVQNEVHRIAGEVEQTQGRLVMALEAIRLEMAERDQVARSGQR